MAINLSIKYAKQIAEMFTRSSFVKPHTNGNLDFTGAKTVRVYMIEPNPENDYQRSGANRYGTPTDVQDTVLEYTMTQDKSFTGVVDKGDESDQTIENKAGKFTQTQLKLVTTPNADKYAIKKFVNYGNTIGISAAPTKSTIVGYFADIQQAMDDKLVPEEGRIAYVPGSVYKLIATSDEFLKLENLGEKSIGRGVVGELFGFKIVKVPTSYMPTGCYVLAVQTSAVAMPYKIAETKVHKDPPGYSGALVEGRHYYDAFVLGNKADAVVGLVLESAKLAAPTISDSTKTAVTLASSGAGKIWYTLDGSDPRFSMSREVYTGAFNGTGCKVRAIAMDTEGKFSSDIAEKQVVS